MEILEKKRALRSCNTDAVKFEQDLNLENPRRLQSGVRQSYSEIMKESSDKANQNLNFGSREKSKTKSRLEKHEKLLRRKKKIREHKRIIEERKNDTKRHKKSLNLIKPGTNKRDCDSDMSQCPNGEYANRPVRLLLRFNSFIGALFAGF